MKTIKKYLFEFLSWVRSLLYLLYWIIIHCFKSDFRNHIHKDNKLKAIDIIVNGPSFAKQQHLVNNDGCDKCMVNFAMNTPVFWDIKPNYYCVSDPSFFCGSNDDQSFITFFDNIKKVDWDMIFFVTYSDYIRHIKQTSLEQLKHITFIPFHSNAIPFDFKFRKLAFWLFKKGQAMPHPESVSIPAIMNCINSGYKTIYLYGYDQDWIHNVVVDQNNRVCIQDTHYYNVNGELRPWLKNKTELYKMYEILKSQTELFQSYWFIREYIDNLKTTHIINMSPVSLIDAFDRNI